VSELFAPSLTEMIVCVEREIRFRRVVYPRRIAGGTMSRDKAAREIETMEAVLEVLTKMTEPQL
jgi:hypothetical protein